MSREFPSILPSGDLVCDCDLQRTEFALGAGISELLSIVECREAIANAGGIDIAKARCGVVARQRLEMLRTSRLIGEPDAA